MSNPLRIATVGTGYFSQFHYDAWRRCEGVELVGIADLNFASAQKLADAFGCTAYGDVVRMLEEEKPDLLDVITPPASHLPLIEQAATHGVNVICQKPFCGDLASAQKAVKLAEAAGIDITIHENFRFQPWYGAIKQALEASRLGELFQITFRLRPGDGQGANAYLDRQPYFQKMERFLVHETAIHYVDVFRYLAGEVSSVQARLDKLNPAIAGEDACLIITQHENGVRGLIDGNRLADHRADNTRRTMGEMVVEGEKGSLVLTGDGAVTFREHGSETITPLAFNWRDHGFGGDCVYLFTRHVVEHYRHGSPRQNSGRDYLRNLEIEEAIYQSNKQQRVLTV